MPTFSHSLVVNAPQSEIFAILDDGPNKTGTRLKYHYKDGKRTGEMDGHITVHDPDNHITMLYTDKMMDVTVDFVALLGKAEGTTSLTHTIDIRTKGFGKIFSPIIRRTLPKQTTDAMNRLKALAASSAARAGCGHR